MKANEISIISNRKHIILSAEEILYIHLQGRKSVIHASDDRNYETYTTMDELAQTLGSSFIRVDRACLVSAKAIHSVGNKIELVNGETLDYTHRRKREIQEHLYSGRRQIAHELSDNDAPTSWPEYQRHYVSFDSVPFAFTDIEMVFNEELSAVDWILRYANEPLARLEKQPLERLIDHSFSSILDAKWLRVYERTALYGETLEIEDYSPEIDTTLKIICFPTFKGHCGCILFDRSAIQNIGGCHSTEQ